LHRRKKGGEGASGWLEEENKKTAIDWGACHPHGEKVGGEEDDGDSWRGRSRDWCGNGEEKLFDGPTH